MSHTKMKWTKPQLIVLARGTPEEAVLLHCKRIGYGADVIAQHLGQQGCDEPAPGNCGACQSRSGS